MSEALKNKLYNFEAQPSSRVWEEVEQALADDYPVLREKLNAFEQAPAEINWKKIENGLEEKSAVVSIKKNYSPFFKYAFIAAALFLLVIAINLLVKPKHENEVAVKPVVTNGDSSPTITGNPVSPQAGVITKSGTNPKDSAARYVTLAHVDGTKVRLSKKVYPVINCAQNTGEGNWSKCKENIQALQAKMATSVSASSTDFGGLLDMLKDLEEKH
jgi:hypothetical protein